MFSRKIVGWQLASHMRTDLVLDALRMALGTRELGADFALVQHTDHGSQYLSYDYAQVLDDHSVLASVGSVGDAYDNALAESFVDTLQDRADQRPRLEDPRPAGARDPRVRRTGSTTTACTSRSMTSRPSSSKTPTTPTDLRPLRARL